MIAISWGDPNATPASTELPSMFGIAGEIANQYGFTRAELVSHRRQRQLVRARQEAMYLCKTRLGLSYPRIARYFGDRDHTTVMYAVEQHEKRLAELKEVPCP